MFKLKAVVRARGEHKQKIQLNLTMSAVKVFDEITKVIPKKKKEVVVVFYLIGTNSFS
jgi:hypothetical protein